MIILGPYSILYSAVRASVEDTAFHSYYMEHVLPRDSIIYQWEHLSAAWNDTYSMAPEYLLLLRSYQVWDYSWYVPYLCMFMLSSRLQHKFMHTVKSRHNARILRESFGLKHVSVVPLGASAAWQPREIGLGGTQDIDVVFFGTSWCKHVRDAFNCNHGRTLREVSFRT